VFFDAISTMKNNTTLSILLVQLLLFSSCLDAEKKAHFRDIDSMVSTLDSLEKAFNAMPNDSFSIVKSNAAAIEKDVKTYFMEDTVDHQFARKMNRLRGIRKGSDFIAMRRSFLDTIFVFQKEQLRILREDIDNGAGKRDEYHSYIDEEKKNMGVIESSFNDYKKRYDAMRSEYYDIEDDIRARVKPFKDKALQQ
jgi:hypothetical protein